MSKLKITTIQADLKWEDIDGNLAHFETLFKQIKGATDIIILPEMFTTGFSMNAKALAEPSDGKTMYWLHEMAETYNAVITGSFIFDESGSYRNRLVWMRPDGTYDYYDKHQLFKMSGEHEHYDAGNDKIIIEHKGWRICPMICYDLRFPVWARNTEDYDLLFYVANWPVTRSKHWRVLLEARAIENQSYVVGVNRYGEAGGFEYSGDTSVFDPFGTNLYQIANQEAVKTIEISKDRVDEVRAQIPYLNDRDKFQMILK